ncbi:MAG: chemotaxis protein CheA [Marinilabiliaceae bacterium]|nr:chemotaxis protein CheA [Marinilabiliaceae bacterium]
MDTNDISKFKQLFIEEVTTLLNSMEGIILELEKKPGDAGLIQEVFRVMHTIKGVSGMYGYQPMNELTHHLENIYDLVRNDKLGINEQILDLTLKAVDQLFVLINDRDIEKADNRSNQERLLKECDHILASVKLHFEPTPSAGSKKENIIRTYHIILKTPQSIDDCGIKLFYAIKDLAEVAQIKSVTGLPMRSDGVEQWNIFATGNVSMEEIEEALMFVYEYCIICKIADFDIFNADALDEKAKELVEHSAEIDESVNQPSDLEGMDVKSGKLNKLQSAIDSIRKNTHRISVESEKLDHLMYLVSEFVTISSQLNISKSAREFLSLRPHFEKLDKLARQFRANVMDVRLVPIRDMTPKFIRMVRDISHDLGKEVDFVTEGMETELDKSSVDMIAEPLVHLLRNALDHGIEIPEKRMESGKDGKGTVKLKAWSSGNNIFIEVSDDGKGLNRKAILKRATDKGYVQQPDKLTEKEVFNLICMPGFTMTDEVTTLSGRGVGMDVVKQKIVEMRGELDINSQPEKGTVFTIKLQQSIAILETLLLRTDNMNCLIPITDIEGCSQRSYQEVSSRIKHGTIGYEERLIPFVSLRELFSLNGDRPEMTKMIILKKNENRFAIFADQIIGQHQAVLKPMGDLLKDHREISAASILGNGEVAYLLDMNALV